VRGLLAFTDYLIAKNYAPASAIRPWESAINAVFSAVYKEAADETDVLNVDLDELSLRFANATGDKYKAESRTAYMQRVGKAILAYREHLEHPDRPPNLKVRKPRGSRQAAPTTSVNGSSSGQTMRTSTPTPAPQTRTYSFPLRNGDAQLVIPREFLREDADRLKTFIESLVFEPRREIPASTGKGEEVG
jgi:hypothetical protein